MKLSDYEKKYLLRLNRQAIPQSEFDRWGKAAAAVVEKMGEKGIAERVNFDGEPVGADDPDATWQITEAGEALLAHNPSRV